MNTASRLCLAVAACLNAALASAEECRRVAAIEGQGTRSTRADCRPSGKIEPYDPDHPRSGRSPGFINLGDGTEVRIGGRSQLDYNVRR